MKQYVINDQEIKKLSEVLLVMIGMRIVMDSFSKKGVFIEHMTPEIETCLREFFEKCK